MDLLERIVLVPHAASGFGVLMALIVLAAVFLFGAPLLILVPIAVIGMTLFLRLYERATQNPQHR